MRATPPSELKTVYVGPRECVTILEALLAAEGIPTYVPLDGVGYSDTGVGSAVVRTGWGDIGSLQVPAALAARAQAIAELEFPLKPAESRQASHRLAYLGMGLVAVVTVLLLANFFLP